MVAQLLRPVRHLVQRALHPWRRANAVARLRAQRLPRRILVLCHGNICRSPFAAAALARALAPAGVDVRSAGLIGPGRSSPAVAIAVARARGIDLTAHRSQLVSPQLIQATDLVIVMDATQRAVVLHDLPGRRESVLLLGDLDPGPFPGRAIADPWERPAAEFEEVYARIERCVDALCDLFGVTNGRIRLKSGAERPASQRNSSPVRDRSSTSAGRQSSTANSS